MLDNCRISNGLSVTTVFGRYRGKIAGWDVVNEAVDETDSVFLRKTLWLERVGEDYVDSAFHFAHRAAPDAKLYYNDYSAEEMNAKSDKVYELVKGMLERGVPVHGVGLQCHFDCREDRTAGMAQNVARLHALGLEVSITELDFRVELPSDSARVAEQAQRYREVMSLVLQAEGCGALLTWGITDRYSWVPGFFEGYGEALPFDKDLQPKPAHAAMLEVLGE